MKANLVIKGDSMLRLPMEKYTVSSSDELFAVQKEYESKQIAKVPDKELIKKKG